MKLITILTRAMLSLVRSGVISHFALIILLVLPANAYAQGSTHAATLPIIDMHFHPDPAWDLTAFVSLFDEVGVTKAGNGARERGPDTDKVALDFALQNPDRIFVFGFGGIRGLINKEGEPAWTLESEAVRKALVSLEADLRAGKLKGIGELHPNTTLSQPKRGGYFPADSPLMQHICRLSSTYKVPLSAHMDATEQSVGEMERLLLSNRNCIWMWAHAGHFAQPPLLRRLLQTHPNLYLELSQRVGPSFYADRIDDDGELRRGWKELLEDFQDRVVIGTDRVKPSLNAYSRVIGLWRQVFSQLSPKAAAKIAHGNAERLLRLSPAN
ncbi:MAG: hypothetical protein A3F74_09800 [Betaproteobacteria bacterium RIFCSPLOWO2_12_FULL_62_58]|nr:MAG: hypothetical protein A3F74_09800 [Betaproteobacteria bacterium RIFCSPLOWO2_12_FULL_62_58]